ncbi:MAG: PKD domain-containing protein [Bryobacterales bacterium]|jgi:hypothetical protein|nr:PKD domain-containing protein [Bryobacterales bacterium]
MLRLLPLLLLTAAGWALERPGVEFKIFQFPPDRIPQIDGDGRDWDMVPESYVIGSDQLSDTVRGKGTNIDRKSLDVRVKVGWVKGENRLYFLYEAYDDYWEFEGPGRHHDIFEIVVDGDLSGGPLIKQMHPHKGLPVEEAHFLFHGVHAQNYHIFTPAEGKDWAMVWGCQPWVKEMPWANAAYKYDFKPRESGKLVLEFWITPFDYAACDGPARSVPSKLVENAILGLSWAVLDYDAPEGQYEGFWNLSHKTTMYGNASDLVAFRLMPLDPPFRKALDPRWSFQVIDMDRRLVAFQDRSEGEITSWRWDFGDGTQSTERHPIHTYQKAGEYDVILWVEGPAGRKRLAKVRDVVVK